MWQPHTTFQAEDTLWNCMVATPRNTSLSDEYRQMFWLHVVKVMFTRAVIFPLMKAKYQSFSKPQKHTSYFRNTLSIWIATLNSKPQPANQAEAYGEAPSHTPCICTPTLSPIHSRLQSLQAGFQQVKGLEEECGASPTDGSTHEGL